MTDTQFKTLCSYLKGILICSVLTAYTTFGTCLGASLHP